MGLSLKQRREKVQLLREEGFKVVGEAGAK